MADKTIVFTKSIVTQKDISEEDNTAYITQLSKPIILKGVSTKTCQNVLYSIDGLNFTEETTIGDDNVLSMAIVPFRIGGAELDSSTSKGISHSMLLKAFSYILGERDINEDINIDEPISKATNSNRGNGAYRYLLQYLAKNKDKIEWDTGDLFTSLDADKQDSFGGSDFITDTISVKLQQYASRPSELNIAKQTDANGSILKPEITMSRELSNNVITIKQSPYFFLYPDACPATDGDPDKLIIDNFWRGGGLLVYGMNSYISTEEIFLLYIFAVS